MIGYLYEIEEILYQLFYHVKGKLLVVFLEIRHFQHNIFLLYAAYVEEWVHVVVSYFPLSLVGGMETLRMKSADDTSTQEREEAHAFEDILQIFFATGIVESIASRSCVGEAARAVIALSRQPDVHF